MSHGAIGNYISDGQIHGGYLLKTITYEQYLSLKNTMNNNHLEKFRKSVLDENSKKTVKRNKEGSIPICQHTLDGKFIKVYGGINLAQNETGITNISYAIRHEGSQAGGYLWKYDDGDYSDIEPYRKNNNAKAVEKIDKETREVISVYESLVEAEKDTGISFKQIWKACNGQRKTVGGFIWRYADKKENIQVRR